MPKVSAGVLLYRKTPGGLEVLLVHPGGPFWHAKDDGVWSIVKGEVEPGEDLLETAKREFQEETGVALIGEPVQLQPVRQRGGKRVHAFAVEGDLDPGKVVSNTFQMQWPPRSGKLREFPEVDRAAFFPTEIAKIKINIGQAPLIAELERLLAED
jgi:predicted NUDIX family NTP pyrophosphohydrolase